MAITPAAGFVGPMPALATEGQKAIDVFYLTRSGAKLEPAFQQQRTNALLEAL